MTVYGKRGQLAIFVIIAIVLIASIATYFIIRGSLGLDGIPSSLQPVFDAYTECIRAETKQALSLAGSQGGYVEVLAYAPGSDYAPFSSHLNFLGFPVPYWYYVSGNGVIKEQIPTQETIANQVEEYLEERVDLCNLDSYAVQGFTIERDAAQARVQIQDERVQVDVDAAVTVWKGEDRARKDTHSVEVTSKLGKFYDLARTVYDYEKKNAFLEEYAVDVLRLYAPVDGVEISCSGKVWKTRDVVDSLQSALEANMGALKLKGDYYQLSEKEGRYFEVDVGKSVDEEVRILYSRTMPSRIEIDGEGVEQEVMIASPVGIQEGLGVLGFCYAPYHFIYDVSFPVMIQIYSGDELFQFPVVVVIDNNVARQALPAAFEVDSAEEFDLCEFRTQPIDVRLYDVELNPVDANLSYQCFNQRCSLGESREGKFSGNAPACTNGYLLTRSAGFADGKVLYSSNKESVAEVILDRTYKVDVEVKVDGRSINGTAILSFVKDDGKSVSTVLPDEPRVTLSEGNYEIQVHVYGNSSITIPGSTKTQCQEVPRSGIFGFFGGTREKCFDITIPATKIEYALRGGGKGTHYFLPDQLEKGKIVLEVDGLPVPKSLEELQYNYASFEELGVYVV